jgi:DNA-3-methyladenine glycosylase
MLNVLVKNGPRDGLILIRALEPRRGLALMRKRRGIEEVRRLCSGPGKLTRRSRSRSAITSSIFVAIRRTAFARGPNGEVEVVADERIGISRAKDFPWRFTLRGSAFVSVPVKKRR